MNKNLKIALIVLSTLLVSILGVRQCINEYGDLSSVSYKVVGMSDDSDRSSQEGLIYQLDDEGDYIRLKGKKVFRDPQDIAKDYYVYITNSYFSNSILFERTREEGDLNFSMMSGYNASLKDGRELEPHFTILDGREYQGTTLVAGLIEEIEENMRFTLMTEVLEEQIDGIYKKMYPEDVILLDKIKSDIPNLITTYTNMDNHLEKDHDIDYEIRFGQFYNLYISRYTSSDKKEFYSLNLARRHINL